MARTRSNSATARAWVVYAGVLGLALYGCCGGQKPEPPAGASPLSVAASLRGTLFCEKGDRLALHWATGDFEVWDTEKGQRLGKVERLPHAAAWCVASPDETTIVGGDRLPQVGENADDFIASVTVWDARSGKRRHTVPVPTAWQQIWTCAWSAQWLDNARILLVCLLRENPGRAASWLRLVVVDTVAGNVAKAAEFKWAGEHVYLSPDRKLALVKADNWLSREKALLRNATAQTHVIELDALKVCAAWSEPPAAPGEGVGVAHHVQWCPAGKAVLTVAWGRPFAVRQWDARSGNLLQTFQEHTDNIYAVALTTGGDKLLTASEDRTVRVWDVKTGKANLVLSGHAAGLNTVALVPGDKLAVSAAEEVVAKVWEVQSGKLKCELPGHDAAVRALEVVSATVVRTITQRGTATTWDCTTGKRLQVTPRPPDYPKRFGVCELANVAGTLQMRIVNPVPNP